MSRQVERVGSCGGKLASSGRENDFGNSITKKPRLPSNNGLESERRGKPRRKEMNLIWEVHKTALVQLLSSIFFRHPKPNKLLLPERNPPIEHKCYNVSLPEDELTLVKMHRNAYPFDHHIWPTSGWIKIQQSYVRDLRANTYAFFLPFLAITHHVVCGIGDLSQPECTELSRDETSRRRDTQKRRNRTLRTPSIQHSSRSKRRSKPLRHIHLCLSPLRRRSHNRSRRKWNTLNRHYYGRNPPIRYDKCEICHERVPWKIQTNWTQLPGNNKTQRMQNRNYARTYPYARFSKHTLLSLRESAHPLFFASIAITCVTLSCGVASCRKKGRLNAHAMWTPQVRLVSSRGRVLSHMKQSIKRRK